MKSYTSTDEKAFIAVQSGATFTEPPSGTDVANLLGYSHFGPSVEPVGSDILDNMGRGAGAIGFTGSLPSGTYTFWSQQTGAASTDYELNFVIAAATVTTGTLHSEATSGDLSGDSAAPTALTAKAGNNLLSATSVRDDREYYTFEVPAGHQLDAIIVKSYTSTDEKAFIAVQSGATFTEPPSGTEVGNLLGYSHFGPAVEAVGSDILDNMGSGAGAIGFSGSLPSGTYTFWSQQTGAASTTYELNFVIAVATETQGNQIFLPIVVNE